MNGVRLLFRNFVTLFAGNVIGQVLFFVGTLYLARVFGPAIYGVWSFAQAWQLYLLRIGEFGFEVTGIREVARSPENTAAWTATVVIVRVCVAFVLYAATLLAGSVGLVPLDAMNVVLLFSLTVFPMAFLLEWVYEAKQNVLVTSLSRIAKGMLFGVGVLFLVGDRTDLNESVLVYVISISIPGAVVFFLAIRSFGFDLSSFTLQKGVDAMRHASSVGFATILSHYSLFVGIMTIGYTLSETDLGLFSAAHRVVVLPWAYIAASLQRVLLPPLSRWYQESSARYSEFVQQFFRLTVLACLGIGIAGTFFGPALMSLLYPSAYADSMGIFVVLLWALVFAGMRFIFEIAMIASGNTKRYLKGMLLLAAIYTIATPLLALKSGVDGVAWACVIAECCYFVYLVSTFPHISMMALVNNAWKPVIGCLLALAVGLSVSLGVYPVRGLLSLGTYAIFIVGFGALSMKDFRGVLNLVLNRKA